ncbi:MAG: hypothetical protein M1476_02660 [Candidatus Thermoplasmatota archaeon]|nr:hypothetical protein [Candidatus Thermoplasmatota archaeon]
MGKIQDNKTVAFTAKAKKVKTHKNQDYFVYRITVPKEEAQKLSIGDEDYLLILAQKAKWYHMLKWDEMSETWNLLPEEVKQEIKDLHMPTPKVWFAESGVRAMSDGKVGRDFVENRATANRRSAFPK